MGGGRSAQYAPTLLPSTRSCREPIFAPFSPSSSWSRRTELVWDWNGPNNNAATPFSPLPPFFAARLGRFIFATATVVSSLSPHSFLSPLSTMAPRYKGGKEVAHPDDNSGGSIWKGKGWEGMFSPLLLVPSRESDFGLFNGNQCIFSTTPLLSMHFPHCLNPQASRGGSPSGT